MARWALVCRSFCPSGTEPASAGPGISAAGHVQVGRLLPARPPALDGVNLQRLRGLIAALVIGVPLGLYIGLWLHGTREIAVLVGFGVGLAIFAVVASGTGARDEAADAAWREAAPDLPPVSDRVILERAQASMPGPGKHRQPAARSRTDGEGSKRDGADSQGAGSE